MSASRCTPQQQRVIETLDRALMVSAGAGSGKTFTLTQRIAAAFQDEGLLDDIDQVLAITYTKKAAAELKSRIKTRLIADGRHDQARKVDDAWVCTIHAMAARILRENALQIGIDPAFEVLDDTDGDVLWNQAVQMVAAEAIASEDALVQRILAEEKLTSAGYGRSLLADARAVLSRVHAMPEGFAGVVLPDADLNAYDILREMMALAAELASIIEGWPKRSDKDEGILGAVRQASDEVRAWIAERPADPSDAAFDPKAFMDLMYRFPSTTPSYGAKKPEAAQFERYRSEYARLFEEARALVALPVTRFVVRLAERLDEAYRHLKGPMRLDNDDLLRECYRALVAHPAIAQRYREAFRAIMVDEFQDTDRLQTAIIERIAHPGLANVCTVGDAQQSIYRFRGADVNVFDEYRRSLFAMSEDAVSVELPDNFRSHGDVLKLVDAIFARPGMFGQAFLHLEPRGAINDEPDPVFDAMPRVQLDLLHYRNSGSKARMGIDEVRAIAAAHIAERFANLARAGVPTRDMALLLGSMKHADVYAEALRAVGLPSMTVAGSTFTASSEAALASHLLRIARDRYDDEAVLAVLLSPLFNITDDALLACASQQGPDGLRKRSLAAGLFDPDESACADLSDPARAMLDLARDALGAFVRQARAGEASAALRALLVHSGALDRAAGQGQAGLAFSGNMEKACRLIATMERDRTGIASLSARFDSHLRLAKERPGLLVAEDAEFVTMMTVHGSKGLEFPHVAIAEMSMKAGPQGAFVAENVGARTYVAGLRPLDPAMRTANGNLRKFTRLDDPILSERCKTAGQRYRAISSFAHEQEAQEAKRLLYVALTRAVRSVMLTVMVGEDPAAAYRGTPLVGELHGALGWPLDAVRSVSALDFGGAQPARVCFEYLPDSLEGDAPDASSTQDENAEEDARPATSFEVPLRAQEAVPPSLPARAIVKDVWSYTSLSQGAVPPSIPSHPVADQTKDAAPDAPADVATELGTAFHRLAQQVIVRTQATGAATPVLPSGADLDAQVRGERLSENGRKRLRSALARWFGSDVAAAFFAYPDKAAEVPFTVKVPDQSGSFYLVGEIDGLAVDGTDAHLVDYKTGGADALSEDELFKKHLFQAQCYAYALLCSGYERVEATFVRVEQPDPAAPDQPQTVRYAFTAQDRERLQQCICDAHGAARAHDGSSSEVTA